MCEIALQLRRGPTGRCGPCLSCGRDDRQPLRSPPMPGHSDQRPRARRGVAPTRLTTLIWHVAAIAGCGSSHATGTSADPAGVVPASAPLYAGAIVRPEGALKAAASAAGRTLTHQADPYLRLLAILQTPGSAPLDFSRDVAGWLGPRAGIFVSSLGTSGQSNTGQLLSLLARGLLGGPRGRARSRSPGAHGVQGAIVMDTSDAGKARSFLESQAQAAPAPTRPATGGSPTRPPPRRHWHSRSVDRFAVIGSEGPARRDRHHARRVLARAIAPGTQSSSPSRPRERSPTSI